MPYSINRTFWEEVTKLHLIPNEYYDIAGFKKGGCSLRPLELAEVGNVDDRLFLHLQCHIGLDSLSWSRLGAHVTGIDFSSESIAFARSLARETGISARFICSDIYNAPKLITEQYDIIFTSYGSIRWLHDLDAWAKNAYDALHEDGFLYIVDTHPKLLKMTAIDTQDYLIRCKFNSSGGVPPEIGYSNDYAHKDIAIKFPRCIWHHDMEHIVNSIILAGFEIEFIHEHYYCEDYYLTTMKKNDQGWYCMIKDKEMLPLMFSIKACRK